MQKMTDLKNCFSGKAIYGDDFSEEQINLWYREEEEAFAELYGKSIRNEQGYSFHSLNNLYAYQYLQKVPVFHNVLGFGASWGYELIPMIDKVEKISIIEASSQTVSTLLGNIIPEYKKPASSGKIEYQDETFDLVTCFDTLHHIPNVTYVLNELFRVTAPGGYVLLREPIHSMGDWMSRREGLTKNERGISDQCLISIIQENKMEVVKKHYYNCMTSFFLRIFKNSNLFNTKAYLYFDKYFSILLSFNIHYHELNKLQRCAPSSVFYVLRKPLNK